MAKLLLNSAGKVLIGNDKVYKAPNYVDIPQVTNIQLSDSGYLSWDAPDITSLASYSPTISYIINVNGYELTSSTTSIDIISYLLTDSENIITVKVKAVLNGYSNNEQETFEAYSLPAEYVRTLLNPKFPYAFTTGTGALVGNKYYYFGGNFSGSYNLADSRKIYRFNIREMTVEQISANFNQYITGRYTNDSNNACAVGNIIYLFGGGNNKSNYIFKFDTETETLTTIETTLPSAMNGILAILYKKNIYLFGNSQSNIFKFDTETETITMLETTLPTTRTFRLIGGIINSTLYLINDYGYYFLFDFETETVGEYSLTQKTISTSYSFSALLFGNNIYLFGQDNILKFDTISKTYTTVDKSIGTGTSSFRYEDKGYVISHGNIIEVKFIG